MAMGTGWKDTALCDSIITILFALLQARYMYYVG